MFVRIFNFPIFLCAPKFKNNYTSSYTFSGLLVCIWLSIQQNFHIISSPEDRHLSIEGASQRLNKHKIDTIF